jgi:hypothetical protein
MLLRVIEKCALGEIPYRRLHAPSTQGFACPSASK